MVGLRYSLLVVASAFCTGAAAEMAGDPSLGADVFRKCSSCHMVGVDARNRVGPELNNILDAPAGAVDGFRYSRALLRAADDGLSWNAENLDAFLESPRAFMRGTKMSFRGLRSPDDRMNLIAYLASFSADGAVSTASTSDASVFTVSSEILAIEGDLEYGEYLSSECTTCHLVDGGNEGIPSIVGWEIEDFVTAMHAYKEKHRENPVMQMVTGRLADDEIAALAAYFKSLDQ